MMASTSPGGVEHASEARSAAQESQRNDSPSSKLAGDANPKDNPRENTEGRVKHPSFLRASSPGKQQQQQEPFVHTPYSKRVSKPLQYLDTWQNRSSTTTSPSKRSSSVANPSPRKLPSIEKRETITNLTEQNETLSEEVKVLFKDKNSLASRVSELEEELRVILAKTQEMASVNKDLSKQVEDTKIQAAAKDSMTATLAKAKNILESEKQYLTEDKSFVENQLLEMNKKLRDSVKRADEAESTVTTVVQQIDGLNRNLARMTKNDATLEVQEIVKQMELHSLQACKDILKKELKKLTGTVMKSREEAAEARLVIESCQADENKFRADVARLEKALKSSTEYSARLEKQERLLRNNIELFEARVRSLENELEYVKAERDAAIKEKIQKEASAGGIDAIKSAIHILHENAKKGHEHVQALSSLMPELSEDRVRSIEISRQLEMRSRELGTRSTAIANAAEEELVRLKEQVDALDSALEEAKDAAEDSESRAWQMISELSSTPTLATSARTVAGAAGKVDLPAATTYVLGLGLLAYSVYMSNHA